MNPLHSAILSAPAENTGQGGGTMTDAKHKVADAAREATSKIKSTASEAAQKAKTQAENLAAEKKEEAANRIGSYSSAVHESARSLEGKDPNIAWFTHRAADRIQRVADYVRDRDFAALRRDTGDFARRHPAVFFGGLFVAGVILGNIARASRDDSPNWRTDDEFEPRGTTPAFTEPGFAGQPLPTEQPPIVT